MATCHACGANHFDFLEMRGGFCPSCAEAKKRGEDLPVVSKPAIEESPAPKAGGMPSLRILAFASFALAALSLIVAISEEELWMVVASISVAISGVLFLALNRIISALEAIRDALQSPSAARAIPAVDE